MAQVEGADACDLQQDGIVMRHNGQRWTLNLTRVDAGNGLKGGTRCAHTPEPGRWHQKEGIEEDSKMEYIFTASLWIGYCALHSYLISIGFTNLMIRLLGNYYAFYRLFYIFISLVLLIPLIKYTGQADTRIIITYEYPCRLSGMHLSLVLWLCFSTLSSSTTIRYHFLEFVKFLILKKQRA